MNLFPAGFTEEAIFTMSNHGRFKLVHDDKEYWKISKNNETSYWICSKYAKTGCKAKARTRRFGQKEMVKFCNEHNHVSKNSTIENDKL